ncbi:extracellular solute-binding protein [Paenibacillus rigui]|nr:extracellular solute-binding protein [Paenibacillus rigui]
MKKLKELSKTNVKVELIPHAEFKQKLQLIFASGEIPDLLQTDGINSTEVAPAIDAGVLLPLNDLIDKYAPNMKKALPKEAWQYGTVSKDGVIYGIPTLEPAPYGGASFIRKDWLDKLGLPVPKTLDEFVTVMKAFRDKDPNGNGKQDELPWSAREKFRFGDAFFGAYGVNPEGWKLVNGELVPNFILPEMKAALDFHRMLYAEKLFDNESFVQQGKDWDAKIRGKGIVGFWSHSAQEAQLWSAEVKKNSPDANVVPIPSPVGPDGKGGYLIRSVVNPKTWVISKSAKNPEEIIKFMDFFFTEEGQRLVTYGIEGDNYTMENGKIKYKYPSASDATAVQEEIARQEWFRFTGPTYLSDPEFMKNKPENEKVVQALEISKKEGRVNDGDGIPALPTLKTRPELKFDGLWLEFAAKVITGKESSDGFDKFVADWKKRGGDQLIKEATQWYNQSKK